MDTIPLDDRRRPVDPPGGSIPHVGARWLLLAWAAGALLAWFVPWPLVLGSRLAGEIGPWSIPLGWVLAVGLVVLALVVRWRSRATPAPRGVTFSIIPAIVLPVAMAGVLHTLVPVGTLLVQTPVFDQRVDCRLDGTIV
ncbi:MAG: hypothetical protein ACOCPR_00850, partial [Guyparkeria sp.]